MLSNIRRLSSNGETSEPAAFAPRPLQRVREDLKKEKTKKKTKELARTASRVVLLCVFVDNYSKGQTFSCCATKVRSAVLLTV